MSNSDYTDSEDPDLQCPRCLKVKRNLGALSAHWDKSCKRKFNTSRLVKKGEQHRIEVFEKKKVEVSMRLTVALNEGIGARRKQAHQGRPAESESFTRGNTNDTPGTSNGNLLHKEPTVNLLPGSDLIMFSTALAHAGVHDILSTSNPVPQFGGGCEAPTVGNQWWMAHELYYNIGYNSEPPKDIDTDVEAWIID